MQDIPDKWIEIYNPDPSIVKIFSGDLIICMLRSTPVLLLVQKMILL